MSDDAGSYPGEELELFAEAVNWKRWFAAHMAPFIRGRVLEAGAGIGGSTPFLLNDHVTHWLAQEPDARHVAALHRKLPARCTVRRGTTCDLPDGETFDTILYVDVLEHISDDRDEVARAARHLAVSGQLIAMVPAHPFLFSPFDAAIGHHRRYSRATVEALTPPACRIVSLKMLDSAGFFLSLGNRLLLRSAMPTRRQIGVWDKVCVPISRVVDPMVGFRFGKSIVVVWRKED